MPSKTDSILAHTLARVVIAEGGTKPGEVTKWEAVKAIPKGTRVTAFLVLWAQAEREVGRELEGIEEYRSIWNESERSAYRHQAECREVWGGEMFRTLIDVLKNAMDDRERRLKEKFDVGRAMSLEVSVEAPA